MTVMRQGVGERAHAPTQQCPHVTCVLVRVLSAQHAAACAVWLQPCCAMPCVVVPTTTSSALTSKRTIASHQQCCSYGRVAIYHALLIRLPSHVAHCESCAVHSPCACCLSVGLSAIHRIAQAICRLPSVGRR
eukprot:10719677-Lingulodinium_polyedra.AAC.1